MTQFSHRSFWIDSYGQYSPNAPLREDIDVDVAIIGGGVTGLSTAYNLRQQDSACRVVVLEGEIIGFGASGRNAGWMMNQFGSDASMVRTLYGRERTRQAIQYCQDGVDYASQMIAEHQMDCDFKRSGLMKIALGDNMLPPDREIQGLPR